MGSVVNSISEGLKWSGPTVVILFTLGKSEAVMSERSFEIAGTRPDRVDTFRMVDDPHKRPATVWEYDLTFEDDSHDLVPYLEQCLRTASAESRGIAWLMFEGVFHFDDLFQDDIADQIYGYCAPGGEPAVTWDHDVMRSDEWKEGIQTVRSVLDSRFPAEGSS
ncbi:hypothetical protein [Streptomyces sp. NPDC085937]|uniref:hypothetical protein n=1 Tax=Streptomyces sp. NPDC085937 TaxID=3365742 RepID=UPI0037CEEBFF